jgi:predicted DCC family thiol-disulfide oxidoreductase YuxK
VMIFGLQSFLLSEAFVTIIPAICLRSFSLICLSLLVQRLLSRLYEILRDNREGCEALTS